MGGVPTPVAWVAWVACLRRCVGQIFSDVGQTFLAWIKIFFGVGQILFGVGKIFWDFSYLSRI